MSTANILKAQAAERAKAEINSMLVAVTNSNLRMKLAEEAKGILDWIDSVQEGRADD